MPGAVPGGVAGASAYDFESVLRVKEPRDKVVAEILLTEIAYVELLQICVELYLIPLRTGESVALSSSSGGSSSPAPPAVSMTLPQEKVSAIFCNLPELLQINTELLRGLKERIEDGRWDSETQRIGDLFCRLAPFLKVYMVYASNFEGANVVLEGLEKQSAFEAFCKQRAEDPRARGNSLRSLLIRPVQRVPRYRLLLQDLVNKTKPDHPDFAGLASSLESIKEVANKINEAIKKHENRQKLLSLQGRISSWSFMSTSSFNLVEAHRSFVREGVLLKVCRKASKKRLFLLFNDVLIYASVLPTNGIAIHGVIPLISLQLSDLPDTDKLQNLFQISSLKKSFVVYAESHQDKVNWLVDISQASSEWRKGMSSLKVEGASTQRAGLEAPVWQPDSMSTACSLCGGGFTLINRRHHCRSCGKLVCADCSTHRLILPIDPSAKSRICEACFKEFSEYQQAKQLRKQQVLQTNSPPVAPAP